MIERPIIFSAPMVRAILDGHKSMTRRLVTSPHSRCQPGDRLWVRERFKIVGSGMDRRGEHLIYDADGAEGYAISPLRVVKVSMTSRPSIHMPRWASRITLEVTGVKVERLLDITPADAIAEGVVPRANSFTIDCDTPNPVDGFRDIWTSLHGDGAWEANPFVVAISFKRISP